MNARLDHCAIESLCIDSADPLDRLLFHRQPEPNDKTKIEIYSRGLRERTGRESNPKNNSNCCRIIQKKKKRPKPLMRSKKHRFSPRFCTQFEYFLRKRTEGRERERERKGTEKTVFPSFKRRHLQIVDEHQRYRYVYLSKDREDIRRQCCVSSIVIRCVVTNHHLKQK